MDPEGETAGVLLLLDYFFTTLFTLEMLLKWIVYGIWFPPEGYFKDAWNCLDGFIVTISLIGIFSTAKVGFLRSLRTLRALRPLRTIRRFPGLKLVVNVLIGCVPVFLNICMVHCDCGSISHLSIIGRWVWAPLMLTTLQPLSARSSTSSSRSWA